MVASEKRRAGDERGCAHHAGPVDPKRITMNMTEEQRRFILGMMKRKPGAGQCVGCSGVVSGEQILLAGAASSADGYVGLGGAFIVTLARGACPGCSSHNYRIKWIGGNW